ncbi:hypothetical protein [Flavobacterium tegetincola]|uniref:hypothetical protein n=1 Tax=Flavobacterium tegetincola TaxID=150172 RepID=UPI000422DD98|nr:hypothetical protein [Flavobacterium tegetincola]
MEQIIKMITEKTGISNEQAATAVNVVTDFLKDKLPAGMGSQLDGLLKGDTSGLGDLAGGLKDGLGGMFGK